MAEREGFRLLGTDAVEDALDRITAAIHAQLGPDVVLIGIRRRGAPLAEQLAERWSRIADMKRRPE
jgi:pyrimidine operon attenuation protein/uracil phosphoribosyltransferase